jgi:SAM-dependent methyltransferase
MTGSSVQARDPESAFRIVRPTRALMGTHLFFHNIRHIASAIGAKRLLDFGAGAGAWYRRPEQREVYDLRDVAEVWACDVDPVVLTHPGSDHQLVIEPGKSLPFEDEAFDLIVADVVFEHIVEPGAVCPELLRVLRPGGVICARTPNKYGYPALATALVPNRHHAGMLRFVQPARRSEDVFPTAFKLNRPGAIRRAFPGCDLQYYGDSAEPSYYFGNRLIYRVMEGVHRILPETLATSYCFFIGKPATA